MVVVNRPRSSDIEDKNTNLVRFGKFFLTGSNEHGPKKVAFSHLPTYST